MKTISYLLAIYLFGILPAFSESLVLNSGTTVEGTIIRTNNGEYLLLTDYGTFGFAERTVKEIRKAAPSAARKSGRLWNFRTAIFSLSQQEWASNLVQIPATVIDNGILKNVPYVSFRCNEDYEVNIYGELTDPAAIEVGVYRKLLTNDAAKSNCLKFITSVLSEAADKEVVQSLNWAKDLKQRSGLSFEVTPPEAEDAFLGWWVSVYSEAKLNSSRASEKELANISVPKPITPEAELGSVWSAEEMKLARAQPETITIVTSSGQTLSNAVVVRVIDGAYLIWRQGASGGKLKLATLPESLRKRFGYDPAKAEAAYYADDQTTKEPIRSVQGQTPTIPAANPTTSAFSTSSSSSYVPSSGGSVYVRGYTKKDGTYVQPYTRSAPHGR